jgi:hypothetical protein
VTFRVGTAEADVSIDVHVDLHESMQRVRSACMVDVMYSSWSYICV